MVAPGEDAARAGPALLAAGAARIVESSFDLERLLP
jgi:hypothetical protein